MRALCGAPARKTFWPSGESTIDLVVPTLSAHVLCSLIRSATERPYPRELLRHPWIVENSKRNINLAKWVAAVTN